MMVVVTMVVVAMMMAVRVMPMVLMGWLSFICYVCVRYVYPLQCNPITKHTNYTQSGQINLSKVSFPPGHSLVHEPTLALYYTALSKAFGALFELPPLWKPINSPRFPSERLQCHLPLHTPPHINKATTTYALPRLSLEFLLAASPPTKYCSSSKPGKSPP